MYFPRSILPVSAILSHVVDFAIALVILFGMMLWYGYQPSFFGILLVIPLLAMTSLSALGIGLLFGSLNVKYRDVRYILPFFMQMLIFITPVIYSATIAPENYRWILGLNPMAGVISLARTGILGVGATDWRLIGISAACMVFYAMIGYVYFKKVERYFADVI